MKKYQVLIAILLLLLFTSSTFAGHVTLDHTYGAWDTGKIYPDCKVTFYLRINNDNSETIDGLTNGFKIWTVGGAPFDTVKADTVFSGYTSFFDGVNSINYFSATGSGEDTVAFSNAIFFSTGLPIGFDEVVFSITTGNIPEGETICLDSSYFPPAGFWLWGEPTIGPITPSWDGPHCFLAETRPDTPPHIFNAPDTIFAFACDTITFDFESCYLCDSSDNDTGLFYTMGGGGVIDTDNGIYNYYSVKNDINTIKTITIGVYDIPFCFGSTISIPIRFYDSGLPGDVDQTCTVDIGDLVFLVNYMFGGGPPPLVVNDADIDGSGEIDIADLVYLVNYMFNNGPPPVG